MKKGNYIWIVFKKECLDIIRDRKTLLVNLLLPIVLYPAMFLLMGNTITGMIEGAEKNTTIAIAPGTPETVKTLFEGNDGIKWLSTDEPVEALKNGDAELALTVKDEGGGKFSLDFVYDEKKSSSSLSLDFAVGCIDEYNRTAVNEKLAAMGINLESLTPVAVAATTVAAATGETESGSAGMMLSMMLPMILVTFLAIGGLATAADLFAGEKERKTLEPLLCVRAGRIDILVGKYLTVTLFSLIAAATSIIGMVAGYFVNPSFMSMGAGLGDAGNAAGFGIEPATLAMVIILIALMAMVFAGLHVAISTYSRTVKEASMYGSFLMLASYVPTFSSIFLQAGDIKRWMMFVPVMNVIGSLKMVLGGVHDYVFFGGSIACSIVFLLLTLALTRSLFRKETLMFRTV